MRGITARRIALHIVGESDIGFTESGRGATAEQVTLRLDELRGLHTDDPGAFDAALAGTPVSRFIAGLRQRHRSLDASADVILLATTHTDRTGRASAPIAAVVRDYVARHLGSVAVETVDEPTMPLTRAWTRKYISEHAQDDTCRWDLHLGGGSTGMLLGVLFELLIGGFPVTLRTEDEAYADVELAGPASPEALKRWLVRHRFYDALAELDRPTWERLAKRQAVDVEWLLEQSCEPARTEPVERAPMRRPASSTSSHIEDAVGSSSTSQATTWITGCIHQYPGDTPRTWQLGERARKVLFDAVQASFAEGLARREITDGAAARTWLQRFGAAHAPPERRYDVVVMLGCIQRRRMAIDADLVTRAGEPLASLLRPDVLAWHDEIKRLSHGSLHVVSEVSEPPPTVLALQHQWLRTQHELAPLSDYPVWPLVEPAPRELRVLLLRVSGMNQAKNDDDVDQVLTRLGAGEVLLVELKSGEAVSTLPRAGMRGPFTVEVDEPDIGKRPSLVGKYRNRLNEFLADLPGAEVVDEVAVVVPLGPKALVTAAMLAAVEFSLHAAAPLRVVTPTGRHGRAGPVATSSVGEDTDRALAALGLDGVLTELAVTALGNLDLTIAENLLRRGSARLHPLADDVAALKRDGFGVLDPSSGDSGATDRTSGNEVVLACARLRLCGTLAQDHPWDAAYLASSVLDHTFRMPPTDTGACHVLGIGEAVLTNDKGWVVGATEPASRPQNWKHLAPWQEVRLRDKDRCPSSALRDLRNAHPLSHGIDYPDENPGRRWDRRREVITVPTADRVIKLIAEAETELRTAIRETYPELAAIEKGIDPDVLVHRYRDLLDRARALAGMPPVGDPATSDA